MKISPPTSFRAKWMETTYHGYVCQLITVCSELLSDFGDTDYFVSNLSEMKIIKERTVFSLSSLMSTLTCGLLFPCS